MPPPDLPQLRRAARRKIPGLLARILLGNVVGVYLVFFLFTGRGDTPQAAPQPSAAVAILRHPITLALWAAVPSLVIVFLYRSMTVQDEHLRGVEFSTPAVAVTMVLFHLLCVAAIWVLFAL